MEVAPEEGVDGQSEWFCCVNYTMKQAGFQGAEAGRIDMLCQRTSSLDKIWYSRVEAKGE